VFTILWNAAHVAVKCVFTISWKPCSRSRGIRMLPKLAAATNQTAVDLLPHHYARLYPPDSS
jgi:hypothetical protein